MYKLNWAVQFQLLFCLAYGHDMTAHSWLFRLLEQHNIIIIIIIIIYYYHSFIMPAGNFTNRKYHNTSIQYNECMNWTELNYNKTPWLTQIIYYFINRLVCRFVKFLINVNISIVVYAVGFGSALSFVVICREKPTKWCSTFAAPEQCQCSPFRVVFFLYIPIVLLQYKVFFLFCWIQSDPMSSLFYIFFVKFSTVKCSFSGFTM